MMGRPPGDSAASTLGTWSRVTLASGERGLPQAEHGHAAGAGLTFSTPTMHSFLKASTR